MLPSRSHWPSRPIAALDAETTGPDPLSDRCVEIAVVLVGADGTRLRGGHHSVVDPGVAIPQDAIDVHGITDDRVRAEGARPAAALAGTIAALERCAAVGLPLVIFNARFDWPLLLAEAARVGLRVPRLPLVDPLVLDRGLDGGREGKRSLDALADLHCIDRGAAHTAIDDAVCAARLTQALATAHPGVARCDLASLQLLQAAWFAHWRDARNGKRKRQGVEGRVTGGWPV